MGKIADGQRTGHGFAGLRKRYVRRAEFLAMDPEYRASTETARKAWNAAWPQYPIVSGDFGMPSAMERDAREWKRHEANVELMRRKKYALADGEITPDEAAQLDPPHIKAWKAWDHVIGSLLENYFPEVDFPDPFDWGCRRCAEDFIVHAIRCDPRLIEDCESFFPPLETIYDEWMTRSSARSSFLGMLPVYPGMTEADVRRLAPRIVQWANTVLSHETPLGRIIALREEGLTHRAIADRMGLTEQTVAAALKSTEDLTTGKS